MGGIKSKALLVPQKRGLCGDGPWWAALGVAVQGRGLGGAMPVPQLCLAVLSSTVYGVQPFLVADILRSKS